MKHFGSTSGLTALVEDQATPASGMVAYVTSSYNSGYQNGDIKGAFLSSTDTTSLVGSGELVTNGDGSTLTGWDDISSGTGTVASVGGEFELVRIDLSNRGIIEQTIATTVGTSYVVSIDRVSGTNVSLGIGTSSGSFSLLLVNLLAGTNTFTFTATSVTTYLNVRGTVDGTAYIDNISVKLADDDRSVNNKGLIVNGTVTRSAVATGAELVAYSGFSASNYLEQPYNSALDFGTGDFCVMGWVKTTDQAFRTILHRSLAGQSGGMVLQKTNTGVLRVFLSASTTYTIALTGTAAVNNGSWKFVSVRREGGTLYLDVDGSNQVSAANTTDITYANTLLRFGVLAGGTEAFNGSLALWRISATAPTAEQIKKIYEDEKVLFQENAKAVLAGTSDAVTALAYDDTTEELLVGTSQYTSVFRGLRRVDEISGSASAISASNGLRVIED